MDASVTPAELWQSLKTDFPPLVIDVRKAEHFRAAPSHLHGALYTWCREGKAEVHTWKPEAYR